MNPMFVDARTTADVPNGDAVFSRHPVGRNAVDAPVVWAWWLWPHLLGLDAPVVAVTWQCWWAHAAGLALPLSREIILGLGVWLIYLADRLADTSEGYRQDEGAARHRFAWWFRRVLLPGAGGVAASLVILTPVLLPGAEFRAGLGLLALAVGYFWLIHCWPGRRWSTVLPKEAVVGGMFGAGTLFFVACRVRHLPGEVWVGNGLFALLCFLNCALITRWERHESDRRERSSLLNAFPRFSAHLRGACGGLAGVALAVAAVSGTWFVVPVAASALLLGVLDWYASKLSADALRLLADAVLLTPLVGLVWATVTR